MRILVTGATGFVGAAVARHWLEAGHETHVLVRNAEAARPLAELGARVFTGSIGDPNEVAEAAEGCEVVVHAAAVASHRASPTVLEWVNVAGTENVLEATRHEGCRRLIFISCADVTLANTDRVNWNEDRHLERLPLDAHARTKQLAEELVLSASATGLETVALRPAVLWGPGDTTTLPRLCREGRGGVRLAGGGKNLVSTTYIDHLVDAVVAAAQADAGNGCPYQITDGEFLTASEFFGALCRAAGLPAPRSGLPYGLAYALAWFRERAGLSGPWRTEVIRQARSIYLDHSRAVHELGFEPRVPLTEGMERVATWVQAMGGAEAVARRERQPATADEVAAQIDLAHQHD